MLFFFSVVVGCEPWKRERDEVYTGWWRANQNERMINDMFVVFSRLELERPYGPPSWGFHGHDLLGFLYCSRAAKLQSAVTGLRLPRHNQTRGPKLRFYNRPSTIFLRLCASAVIARASEIIQSAHSQAFPDLPSPRAPHRPR